MTETREKATASQDNGLHPSAGTPTEVVSGTMLDETDQLVKIQEALIKAVTPAGAFMTDDHRYYFNGDGPVPSVTTILEVLDKPALTTWKQQQAVKAAIHLAREGYMDGDQWSDEQLMQMALADARKGRDSAASVGSSVHLLADMVTRSDRSDSKAFGISDEVRPYLEAYRAFSDRYERSSFVSSEKVVWSLNGYAGTYDLLLMIDGELWLLDLKTGRGLYPEFALQLAAYRWADWIILPGNPQHYDMPNVDRTGILHLRPDLYPEQGYKLWEYPTDYETDYLTFLGLLEAWKWKQRKVKPIDRSHKD